MSNKPKWATPDRQSALVRIFTISRGFCVFGHKDCLIPEHHYELFAEVLIKDWIADDKAEKAAEWQFEREALHRTNDRRYPLEGQFSGVGKDVFYSSQPQYYLVGLGMSGLTLTPFAKVRLASSFIALHIDLGDSLKGISKNKRRKAIRYGRVTDTIRTRVREAVRHYFDHIAD
ncbi:MAG: hypothetical protein HYX80_09690 [Chloroflexi bacterium]|nr:hypothetical protein [Chloroflexota bacterium]